MAVTHLELDVVVFPACDVDTVALSVGVMSV